MLVVRRCNGCQFARQAMLHPRSRALHNHGAVSSGVTVARHRAGALSSRIPMTAQPLRFEPEFPRGPRHPVSVASSPSGSEPSGADTATARRVDVRHPVGRAAPGGSAVVLTPEALAFVADLVDRFGPAVRELLAARADRRERL